MKHDIGFQTGWSSRNQLSVWTTRTAGGAAYTAEREVRSTAYQLKTARFPTYHDLDCFDFGSREINEGLVGQPHRCEFMNEANNIVLVGGPWFAIDLGATSSGNPPVYCWRVNSKVRSGVAAAIRKLPR